MTEESFRSIRRALARIEQARLLIRDHLPAYAVQELADATRELEPLVPTLTPLPIPEPPPPSPALEQIQRDEQRSFEAGLVKRSKAVRLERPG